LIAIQPAMLYVVVLAQSHHYLLLKSYSWVVKLCRMPEV
jgi:hypothetical protein